MIVIGHHGSIAWRRRLWRPADRGFRSRLKNGIVRSHIVRRRGIQLNQLCALNVFGTLWIDPI